MPTQHVFTPGGSLAESLCAAARDAAFTAYAPYSGFRVGAAVLAGGDVFTGANIENATYGATVCAERVALAAARVAGAGPAEVAVLFFPDVAPTAPVSALLPCGICRQWFVELAPDCAIYVCQRNRVFTAAELLPEAFRLDRGDRG